VLDLFIHFPPKEKEGIKKGAPVYSKDNSTMTPRKGTDRPG
jgi:hypothetical protein